MAQYFGIAEPLKASLAHAMSRRLLALLIVPAMVAGLAACSASTPGKTTSMSAIPTPKATQAELTVDSLQLDATATPEELGATFVQRINEWEMAGTNKDTYDRSLKFTGSDQAFLDQEATKNTKIFAEALLGPGWANNHAFDNLVAHFQNQNEASLRDYLATYKQKTSFVWKETVTGTPSIASTSPDGATTTVNVSFISTNNYKDSHVEDIDPATVTLNGEKTSAQVTFAKNGNNIYVTSFK